MLSDSRIHKSVDIEVYIFSTLAQIDTYVCKKHPSLICGPYAFLRKESQSHIFLIQFSILIAMSPTSKHHPLGDANVYHLTSFLVNIMFLFLVNTVKLTSGLYGLLLLFLYSRRL